jgi:hypothetical protein
MHDSAMNDILSKFNAVGNKSASTSASQQSRSSSAGDPAMHSILSKFAAVSGTQSALKTPGQLALAEGLGAEQKRVGQVGPTDMPDKKKDHPFKGQLVGEDSNPVDTVTMDVPLMIRMFEYAREEAKSDMDLHDVAEKLIALGTGGGTLTMDNYEDIVSNVENGIEDHEMDEAAGGALDDTAYGGADKTVTPSVNGFSQSRDLNTGSYTDRYDNGAMQVSKTYDKSGQQTGQSATYRMGDKTISRSQDASGHSGKDITTMGNDRRIDSYKGQDANSLKQTGTEYERRYWDDNTNTKGWEKASTHGTTDDGRHKSTFYPKRKGVTYADSNTQANANKLFQDQHSEMRKLAGLATEDYVGGREAPQDLVKSLSKSYKDFVKEVEQQNAAKPDRELRSKTEKPKKFGNILDELK